MQRTVIIVGALILAAGLLWRWVSRLGLGRLPGDIRIETENGIFFLPITTCIIVSVAVSMVLWFIRR